MGSLSGGCVERSDPAHPNEASANPQMVLAYALVILEKVRMLVEFDHPGNPKAGLTKNPEEVLWFGGQGTCPPSPDFRSLILAHFF